MKKILIIYGGKSEEHEISCKSYKSVLKNINKNEFIVDSIYISKENKWYKDSKEIKNIIEELKKYNLVLPLIHGKYGEDGKLQGLLEMFDINYVGSKLGSSYLCMDKKRTKQIVSKLDIPQVKYQSADDKLNLNLPIIVKPCNGGSSIGINVAHNIEELNKYINKAKKYDKQVILEEFLDNPKEIECAVIKINNKLIMEVGELNCQNEFYDYDTKYKTNQVKINYNPNININLIKEYAKKIFEEFELCDYARIDFLYYNNKIYFNEINTIPGFTDTSMFPNLLINSGMSFEEIITNLLKKM